MSSFPKGKSPTGCIETCKHCHRRRFFAFMGGYIYED